MSLYPMLLPISDLILTSLFRPLTLRTLLESYLTPPEDEHKHELPDPRKAASPAEEIENPYVGGKQQDGFGVDGAQHDGLDANGVQNDGFGTNGHQPDHFGVAGSSEKKTPSRPQSSRTITSQRITPASSPSEERPKSSSQ